jgi:hypothetical protein
VYRANNADSGYADLFHNNPSNDFVLLKANQESIVKANITDFIFERKSSRVGYRESVCVLWKRLFCKHYGVGAEIGTVAGVSPSVELDGISKTACPQF